MTKKDYVKFAALLKQTNPLKGGVQALPFGCSDGYVLKQHSRIIAGIASIFKEDNPNFDVNRFINAIIK